MTRSYPTTDLDQVSAGVVGFLWVEVRLDVSRGLDGTEGKTNTGPEGREL